MGSLSPEEIMRQSIEKSSQKIFDRINEEWQNRIGSGQVNPPLKEFTINWKNKKGYSNPSAPLYATGNLKDSLRMETDGESVSIISSSDVMLSWHGASIYEGLNMAQNNPERKVFTKEEAQEIIIEELQNQVYELIRSQNA